MAAIDYAAIKTEMAEIIRADSTLQSIYVTVDDDISLDSFGSSINVEMTRRDPNAPGQSLSGGQKQRYYLTAVVSVVSVALERQQAVENRDGIVGKVEVALMRNRSLNGKVNTLFLNGGELFLLRNSSPETEGFFVAAGEVVVLLDAEISTV